jgi:hypothetical protein
MPLTVTNPAGTAKHSGQLSDLLSTKWLPQIPPRLMAFIEGWGYDSLPDLSDKVFLITGASVRDQPTGLVDHHSCWMHMMNWVEGMMYAYNFTAL